VSIDALKVRLAATSTLRATDHIIAVMVSINTGRATRVMRPL